MRIRLFLTAGYRRETENLNLPIDRSMVLANRDRRVSALDRHLHGRPQPPQRAGAQRDVAAVGARDVAGDGQA